MSKLRDDGGSLKRKGPWALAVLVIVVALAWWYWGGSTPPSADAPVAAGSTGGPSRASGAAASGTSGRPQGPGGMAGAMTVPVRVATVEQQPISTLFTAVGTVTAFNTVTVRSRVDGELQRIYFDDGQKVKAGDVLAQIDPRPFQVALDQALGQQAQNQAQLQNARSDLKRYEQLFAQNSLARQQLETQRALVQQYQGAQKSDKANVDSARLQLEFSKITAPISGRLGLRVVDQGNLISSGSAEGLVVITQTQPISVFFSLPQAQLPAVLERFGGGQALQVDAFDGGFNRKLAQGTLEAIDNQIDVATGTVRLKARFDNDDDALFPNQFVNVRLRVSTQGNALVIPTAAVQQGSAGAFVYVVGDDDTVTVQPVKTGTIEGRRVAVVEGLVAGQRVVTEGVDRLRAGTRVQIIQP
ncbi:MAG: MdtA/MuxA family multidrug efflux RND transporter periplasmic adaptor subunit [Pusillimonas sp.]